MKKVLFISSRPIFPITGGDQIRTAQQLEYLSKKYKVDVIYIKTSQIIDKTKEYQPNVHNVYDIYIPTYKCYFQTLRFLFNKLPLQVNYYYNYHIADFINKQINKYDIVFCNNIRTAEYVINHVGIYKCIDFVDAISMNYEKAKQIAKGIKKLIYSIDYKRTKIYEQKVLQHFDRCAVISNVDQNYLLECHTKYSL